MEELRKIEENFRVSATVLSSRQRSCIHPLVVREENKEEACAAQRGQDGPGCQFYRRRKDLVQCSAVRHAVVDLEDMVRFGQEHKACPYYAARERARQVDVVVCPYVYLLDPLIRQEMEVDLAGSVSTGSFAHLLLQTPSPHVFTGGVQQ